MNLFVLRCISKIPYITVILLIASTIGLYFCRQAIESHYREEILQEIKTQTESEGKLIVELLSQGISFTRLDELFQKNRQDNWRQSLLDKNGKLLADSDLQQNERTTYRNRREVHNALQGIAGFQTRYSVTAKEDACFYAMPLEVKGERYVFRTAVPERQLQGIPFFLSAFLTLSYFASLIPLLFIACYNYFYYRRPMEQLLRYAQWIAHSKLNVPQEKYPPGLAAELAVELQSLAVQLRKLVDSLHRLEFFRRDFIANISHEVKTPITAILASVENLKLCYKAQNNEISAECMASLERQTKRLHLLILDILHLAELEEMEEKDHKFFFPIEVKSLLEAIQMDLGELAGRVNIQLELISCGDEKILGDEELLQQAVSNLIMNAINHSQSSRIEFGAETEEGRVGIFVRDFGIGIPEEHQVRIFERFYRIDKARSQSSAKGTGLGLAIVKHIAQLHDASIICENSVPHGCTFSITFPRVTMAPGNTNRHSVKTV